MLQIQRNNLDELAKKHYQIIEKYLKDKSKGHNLLHFENLITSNLGNNYNLKSIIIAKYEYLKDLENIYINLSEPVKNEFECFIRLYKDFSYGYSKYDKKTKKTENVYIKDANNRDYNGFVFANLLNLSICPYCNRNFIYNTDNYRPSEIDHFFPKEKTKILAVSFYNLIPICKPCNHVKKEQEIGLSPYHKDKTIFERIKFGFKLIDSNFYTNTQSINLNFDLSKLTDEEKELFQKNINVLHLKDLYDQHKDYVLDILQKNVVYNDSYLESLFTQFEGTLFKNKEDVMRLVLSNYTSEEDLGKRPLAKLTRDISEELGLL
jgi:5-methylcytosine-specific restriction endonuclease McrA